MKIPQHIIDCFSDRKQGFARLWRHYLTECKSQNEAFEMAMAEINIHFPNSEMYANFDSFRQALAKQINGVRDTKLVDVPDDVVSALRGGKHYDELWWTFYQKERNQNVAFKRTNAYIHKYVPDYNPYSSEKSHAKARNRRQQDDLNRQKAAQKRVAAEKKAAAAKTPPTDEQSAIKKATADISKEVDKQIAQAIKPKPAQKALKRAPGRRKTAPKPRKKK